ncbi:MAG TPA: 2-dehydropantoate 2-reductase [Stellaceae bacterium]|nr:2-dehydropantoate 2-reductase [Stellaceae bacterium]
MKICIYGAGAIGSYLAVMLARGGAEVTAIARGAQLQAIRRDGLHLHTQEGEFSARLLAAEHPAELGPQDAVIVAVKAPALPSVAQGIGALLGRDTSVAFAMNGIPWWYFHDLSGPLDGQRLPRIDPGGAMWQAVGPERSLAGVVYAPCTVTAPGVVQRDGAEGRIVLGGPDRRSPQRAEPIAALLRAGGMRADVSDEIRRALWEKLLRLLASGPMAVLTQAPPRDIFTDPVLVAASQRMVEEAAGIARALGCPIEGDLEASMRANRNAAHKTSILQDLELGRPMEIDGIYDVLLHLASLVDVKVPTVALLVALTKARARAAGLYAG